MQVLDLGLLGDCLQRQRDPFALEIDLLHEDGHVVADAHDVGRMVDSAVGEL